ncbi:MAG: recombinase family protein [Drouetiella hepatica Uher 2000/2452]|uniref:Recombinase family protein n=1 Tax=Drouetiella hepatica Uher 2000/2452 TaxID=904376 RepID=A0A951QAV5_9CYAN|nr:recombinase family protein [Drouetiella hepatica Uher 2000/2452]
MSFDSVWITGSTRSGKTTRLIEQFCVWSDIRRVEGQPQARHQIPPSILIFAAIGDNRLDLTNRITAATDGRHICDSATPLGFFQDEVRLFYPLLAEKLAEALQVRSQFPVRLRPETEQELATRLWRSLLLSGRLRQEGVSDYFMVRRTLDLLQLCAVSGTPHEEISLLLKQGIPEQEGSPELWDAMGEALQHWWEWCLERGLLTYGILTELYWRYLLPHPVYQKHLKQRYRAVLADDLDEYPAIARSLFEFFLDENIPCAFTYNPDGAIRLGLGADPLYLAGLRDRCTHLETLAQTPGESLGVTWGGLVTAWIQEPMLLPQLPSTIQTLQTLSRAELLRQTAELIANGIETGQVRPEDVAIIAPGMDAIARYTLREILSRRNIAVRSLNDQQPLASSPIIRALLTLLAWVYPGLGRLVDRESVAAMLVLLSQAAGDREMGRWGDGWDKELPESTPRLSVVPRIDPVRAGLLIDHCFVPDPQLPQLLPVSAFPRWDRLGYQATQAYEEITQWLETQRSQQQQHLLSSPIVLLDRAIQRFLYGGSHLPYDQLAALRELMETTQHYWEVETRLMQASGQSQHGSAQRSDQTDRSIAESVGQFIQLLRDGTITADPYPVRPMGDANHVTLATIYQYRSDRHAHRWQFWLDAGSPFWLTGGGALFGAPLFLRHRLGRLWTPEDTLAMDQQRLQRQVLDLLHRTGDRVYLCHSDLATGGQEQAGSLLSLVNAAVAVNS